MRSNIIFRDGAFSAVIVWGGEWGVVWGRYLAIGDQGGHCCPLKVWGLCPQERQSIDIQRILLHNISSSFSSSSLPCSWFHLTCALNNEEMKEDGLTLSKVYSDDLTREHNKITRLHLLLILWMWTSWKWLAPAKSEGRRGEGPKTGLRTEVQKLGSKNQGKKPEVLKQRAVRSCVFLVFFERVRPDGPPPLTFKSYSF